MAAAMARQEYTLDPRKAPEQKLVGRIPPRRLDPSPAFVFQPVDIVQAGAPDNADNRLNNGISGGRRTRPFVSRHR
jgi:hypothetical protein